MHRRRVPAPVRARKRCSVCSIEKPNTFKYFPGARGRSAGGIDPRCRVCTNSYMRAYRKLNGRGRDVRKRGGVPGLYGRRLTGWINVTLMDQDGRCAYCKHDLHGDYEIDHIVAVAKGGGNDFDNRAWHVGHVTGIRALGQQKNGCS